MDGWMDEWMDAWERKGWGGWIDENGDGIIMDG